MSGQLETDLPVKHHLSPTASEAVHPVAHGIPCLFQIHRLLQSSTCLSLTLYLSGSASTRPGPGYVCDTLSSPTDEKMAAVMNGSTTMVSESRPRKIWRSEISIPIPSADILTFAFANLGQYDENKPVSPLLVPDAPPRRVRVKLSSTDDIVSQIYVDANDPSSYISARDARATIRRVVRGLKARGLEEGERVCLVSSNNVRSCPTGCRCRSCATLRRRTLRKDSRRFVDF